MADEPIKVGSAESFGGLVPQAGWEIVTNEFGMDVVTLEYFLGDASSAMSIRPRRGDNYSGSISALSGFKCDAATVRGLEGTAAALRVTFMLPNPTIPYRIVSTSQIGGPFVSASQPGFFLYQFKDLPKPDPVVYKRFCTDQKPDNLSGRLAALGSPGTEDFPSITAGGYYSNTDLFPLFKVFWFNSSFEPVEFCHKAFYQVTETWRPVLIDTLFPIN